MGSRYGEDNPPQRRGAQKIVNHETGNRSIEPQMRRINRYIASIRDFSIRSD